MKRVRPKALVSWSSGKDSAYALWRLTQRDAVDVVGLLTTVTKEFRRVSMHGVRESLLEQQAIAVGLPLWKVEIPYPCPNETYEREMGKALERMRTEGIAQIVFGDLFLPDIRQYRESRLVGSGIEPQFPLWGIDTSELARAMIRDGMEARIVCLDPRKIPRELAGRRFDASLLADLPPTSDPCGENGEFHTFVSNGPMFKHPIPIASGETVERDGLVFSDLLPP
jgi:uncharacterized protein (TIGR00290 family)